jgi:hypothetical protein
MHVDDPDAVHAEAVTGAQLSDPLFTASTAGAWAASSTRLVMNGKSDDKRRGVATGHFPSSAAASQQQRRVWEDDTRATDSPCIIRGGTLDVDVQEVLSPCASLGVAL